MTGQGSKLSLYEPDGAVANTTQATIDLLNMAELENKNALILADKEHPTEYLIRSIERDRNFEFLVPAISTERIRKIERSQTYQRKWAGYTTAETMFNFAGHKERYRLIS